MDIYSLNLKLIWFYFPSRTADFSVQSGQFNNTAISFMVKKDLTNDQNKVNGYNLNCVILVWLMILR